MDTTELRKFNMKLTQTSRLCAIGLLAYLFKWPLLGFVVVTLCWWAPLSALNLTSIWNMCLDLERIRIWILNTIRTFNEFKLNSCVWIGFWEIYIYHAHYNAFRGPGGKKLAFVPRNIFTLKLRFFGHTHQMCFFV